MKVFPTTEQMRSEENQKPDCASYPVLGKEVEIIVMHLDRVAVHSKGPELPAVK